MTTSNFVWPDDVNSNLVVERLHAAIREYMREAAKTAFDGYAGLRDKANTLLMADVMASLFQGEHISQDVCMLASYLFGRVVNVVQYAPGQKALHVTRYGGTHCSSLMMMCLHDAPLVSWQNMHHLPAAIMVTIVFQSFCV